MVLIVEDGTGLENAESYVSVLEADTYFFQQGNVLWPTKTEEEKEQALRKATSYLDTSYRWKGQLFSDEQALSFPRINIYDREGRDLSKSVPRAVKNASYILAVSTFNGELIENVDNTKYIVKEKVGSLEVQYREDAPTQRQHNSVDILLYDMYTMKVTSKNRIVIR